MRLSENGRDESGEESHEEQNQIRVRAKREGSRTATSGDAGNALAEVRLQKKEKQRVLKPMPKCAWDASVLSSEAVSCNK
jgi:hypothetical protein